MKRQVKKQLDEARELNLDPHEIKAEMKELGLKSRDLLKPLRRSFPTISLALSGKRPIVLKKIKEYLNTLQSGR